MSTSYLAALYFFACPIKWHSSFMSILPTDKYAPVFELSSWCSICLNFRTQVFFLFLLTLIFLPFFFFFPMNHMEKKIIWNLGGEKEKIKVILRKQLEKLWPRTVEKPQMEAMSFKLLTYPLVTKAYCHAK